MDLSKANALRECAYHAWFHPIFHIHKRQVHRILEMYMLFLSSKIEDFQTFMSSLCGRRFLHMYTHPLQIPESNLRVYLLSLYCQRVLSRIVTQYCPPNLWPLHIPDQKHIQISDSFLCFPTLFLLIKFPSHTPFALRTERNYILQVTATSHIPQHQFLPFSLLVPFKTRSISFLSMMSIVSVSLLR